mgnify:CR=1 FL=1
MSGTKEKILTAARVLFNEQGVAKISQRSISDHLAISPGNLTYHFKKRDDIIEALYFDLVEEMNESFSKVEAKEPSLEMLMTLTHSIHKNLFENRFFMIDFVQILRSNTKIKKHYVQLSKMRKGQIGGVIEVLIRNGIMRKAELPAEYEHLHRRMQLFGDFWIASIGTTGDEVMLKDTEVYAEMFMQSIYPYLTNKGKEDFRKVMRYS